MTNLFSFSQVLKDLIKSEYASLLKLGLDKPESAKFVAALQKFNVIAVYPFGSRLYGIPSPDSDYDFLMVATNLHGVQLECETLCKIHGAYDKEKTLVRVHGEMHFNGVSLDFGQADIGVYDELYWRELLHQNVNCIFLI
jgi:predicted nucleotidyltransferase